MKNKSKLNRAIACVLSSALVATSFSGNIVIGAEFTDTPVTFISAEDESKHNVYWLVNENELHLSGIALDGYELLTGGSYHPWTSDGITKVIVENDIYPLDVSYWFSDMNELTEIQNPWFMHKEYIEYKTDVFYGCDALVIPETLIDLNQNESLEDSGNLENLSEDVVVQEEAKDHLNEDPVLQNNASGLEDLVISETLGNNTPTPSVTTAPEIEDIKTSEVLGEKIPSDVSPTEIPAVIPEDENISETLGNNTPTPSVTMVPEIEDIKTSEVLGEKIPSDVSPTEIPAVIPEDENLSEDTLEKGDADASENTDESKVTPTESTKGKDTNDAESVESVGEHFTSSDENSDSVDENADDNTDGNIAALMLLSDDVAGAAMDIAPFAYPNVEDGDWTFDAYYVKQNDLYHVDKTDNFSLKYQFEFHNNIDLEPFSVEIRIPKTLLVDRNNKSIYPSEIGVPKGTADNFTEIANSPFNYYEDGDNLVFFNYKKIVSGTNSAIQVLYKNLEVLDIVDNTTWSIEPKATVGNSSKTTKPLTGFVDTKVKLDRTTKTALDISGKSFTPGLYTKSQVKAYVGNLPEKFENNFNDYVYVLWEVTNTGSNTQPWSMFLNDETEAVNNSVSVPGEVVGVTTIIGDRKHSTTLEDNGYKVSDYKSDYNFSRNFSPKYHIVTAYPKDSMISGETVLKNNVTTVLHPADGVDADQKGSASAQWVWKDYTWSYGGDSTEIQKYTESKGLKDKEFSAWLDIYRNYKAEGRDLGGIPFIIQSKVQGYNETHYTSGDDTGAYKPGSFYQMTTVEDSVYVKSQTNGKDILLSSDDYYFSKVTISQLDRGYDVFEDTFANVSTVEGVDQGLRVYAMFEGRNDWEEVGYTGWKDSGVMEYVLSKEALERKPWKIKAVHNAVDYSSECTINVDVVIRHDSPVFDSYSDELGFVKMTNYGGVYKNSQNMQKSSSTATLEHIKPHAQAHKYAKVYNDPNNGRYSLRYTIIGHEGYELYSQSAIKSLKDVKQPDRKEVVFYDLLPLGVQFDPSVEVKAARVKRHYDKTLGDSSQVSVTVNSKSDIITNWRNTGRTLVKFHVKYNGADPSVYDGNYWMAGYGVSFGAYCNWMDAEEAELVPNICAYMPEDPNDPLLGKDNEVFKDDGTIGGVYKDFGSDINDDGITDVKNVLFANAKAFEDAAMSASSSIDKTVRSDLDRFGEFSKSTSVRPGDSYAYDICVTNTSILELTDIIMYDRLENAAVDRVGQETDIDFEDSWWTGTFVGVDTQAAKERGANPVVYYHSDRNVRFPEGDEAPNLEADGWIESDEWKDGEVKAVAVDFGNFVVNNMESISFQINMKAPETKPVEVYAYNAPAFYSVSKSFGEENAIPQTVLGNSVKVKMVDKKELEVIKEVVGEKTGDEFEFTAYEGNKRYSFKEFYLYDLVDGEWVAQNGVRSTNTYGRFYLKDGQKAVFKDVSDNVDVVETDELEWQSIKEVSGDTITFKNKRRAVVFLNKKLTGAPADILNTNEKFKFCVLSNGAPLANTEYWIVDGDSKKDVGFTDKNGMLEISSGEKAALFFENIGDVYEIKEVVDENSAWIPLTESMSGVASYVNCNETFTNVYKYKSLNLKKLVSHKEGCDDEFSFRVWEMEKGVVFDKNNPNGKLMTGNTWQIENGELKTVGDDGIIRAACAGKTIKINGLEARKTYVVEEINTPEYYKPENDGLLEVEMPFYGVSVNGEITNEYLKRTLSVSKMILPSSEGQSVTVDKEFTMKLSLKDGNSFKPASGVHYVIKSNGIVVRNGNTGADGSFSIKASETAEFEEIAVKDTEYQVLEVPDEEYPPVFPEKDTPLDGVLHDNSEVTMINGEKGCLIIQKKYKAMDDKTKELLNNHDFLEFLNAKFTVEIENQPLSANVLLLDKETGVIEQKHIDGELSMRGDQMAIVQGLKIGTKFKVTEVNQHGIQYHTTYGYVRTDQVTPENDLPAQGVVGGDPADIVNGIKIQKMESRIYKRMSNDSIEVPDGKKILVRIERYNGSTWQPAEGVNYVMETSKGSGTEIKKTGPYGIIEIEKKNGIIPIVAFGEKVNLNLTNGMKKGDLRAVEVYADDEFGRLIGYWSNSFLNNEMNPMMDLDSSLADTFVNSNNYRIIEVEKKLKEPSDQEFMITLNQVHPGKDYKSPGMFMPYTVYEAETGKELEKGVTNSNGEFYLKGGEVAKFYLPSGAYWQFDETVPFPYELEQTEGGIIGPSNDAGVDVVEVAKGYLTREMVDFGVYNPDTKERINLTSGDVVIPQKVLYKGHVIELTGIQSYAFRNYPDITSVVIPEGITKIEDFAFGYVTNMKEISLPQSLVEIGKNAFEQCAKLESISLPNGVTDVGDYAFVGCKALESVKISENLTKISNHMFDSCTGLKHITIPENVEQLGTYSFNGCTNLESIELIGNMSLIGDYSFSGCAALKSVVIPEGISNIGTFVFANCTSLESVTLPKSLKSFGMYTFYGCTSLPSIELPEGMTSLGTYTFYACSGLETVKVPDGIKSIEDGVFATCTALKSVALPDSLTRVGANVFAECHVLDNLVLPDNVESIGEHAFKGCEIMSTINIPTKMTTIGSNAFDGFSGLSRIDIPETVTNIATSAFSGCEGMAFYIDKLKGSISGAPWGASKYEIFWKDGTEGSAYDYTDGVVFYQKEGTIYKVSGVDDSVVTEVKIPESVNGYTVAKIDHNAFYNCSRLTKIELPNTIVSMGRRVFYGCTNLKEITIPSGIKVFADALFYGCKNLEKVVATDQLTTISAEAFKGCEKLVDFKIPAKVTTIGYSAFEGCKSMNEFIIPGGVTRIEDKTFKGCESLTKVQLNSNVWFLGDYVFEDCLSLAEINIPSKVTFIGTSVFSDCQSLSKVSFPSGLDSIGDYAFERCYSLSEINLPADIRSFGKYVFSDCKNLKSIVLPRKVYSLGIACFSGCSSLEKVEMLGTMTKIENYTFMNCVNLKEVVLPSNLTSIGSKAFMGCESMTNISLPSTLTSIADQAFSGCNTLGNVVIPNSITSIAANTFFGCRSLKEINIPSSVKTIDETAFLSCRSLVRINIDRPQGSISGAPWGASNEALVVLWSE